MARTVYPKSKAPLSPPPPEMDGPGRMPRLLLEARWFISVGLCLGLFAILLTYSKADPAWSHASFETPRNLGGRFGAY
ncbi:DNA translocase FtsK 4TM domain-containing protein, partial [Polynucleobacter sp. UB-Raua-W9]|uniref:DNA translocase FtsK 4TM domain-containing protein n=1 Tax=Polynucleobacter sp. UB-Raua-W9 TaxID=1819736 RepID=UPI0020408AF0